MISACQKQGPASGLTGELPSCPPSTPPCALETTSDPPKVLRSRHWVPTHQKENSFLLPDELLLILSGPVLWHLLMSTLLVLHAVSPSCIKQ